MIDTKYSPADIEAKWYSYWLKNKLFEPTGKGVPFAVPIPPPNVTGVLHIGHCLNNSIQDVLVRYKRMKGFDTLWIPGLDHAGISTQQKVMQKLEKDGKDLKKVTKEEFLAEAWAWKEKYGNTILEQYKKLGLSLAWSKTTFTLDDNYASAVKDFFIKLYKDDLIYRGEYLVNWSTEFNTALSDDEVEHRILKRKIWDIAYKTTDGDEIVISTTRPETMLADSAVAVNPKDKRYKHLVGKTAIIPIINREIPIISDEYVKLDFGTGALKVTPSNDANDFAIGKRHNLEIINLFDRNINIDIAPYKGMSVEETREKILEDLNKLGAVRKVSDIESFVGFCSKSGKQIETLVSTQWFVKMKPLAKKALEAVKSGEIEIFPQYWVKTYNHWLENIEDWCISRQLWWGHRIPVSYEGSKIHLDTDKYIQEEDVLDTWFSSALWPFATLGWPNKTKDLERYFPTDIVVTGGDIIFFWIARMIMSSLYCLDKIPFKKVLFHGIVRDELGRKMSKSLGNSPNPLDIIEKYGADALRFALIYNNNMGNDLNYAESWVEMGRNVCNKLWNIYRFIEMNSTEEHRARAANINQTLDTTKLDQIDKWIIYTLEESLDKIAENIDNSTLDIALKEVYSLFWNNFADWYIELVKGDLKNQPHKLDVLYYIFKNILKLMHPFIPFITEELYQNITQHTLVTERFPQKVFNFKKIDLDTFKDSVKLVRNIKQEFGVPCTEIEVKILKGQIMQKELEKFLNANIRVVEAFSGKAILKATESVEVAVLVEDQYLAKEKTRLEGMLEKERASYTKVESKLTDPSFISKAPNHVIQKEKEILKEYAEKIESIQKQLSLLGR